jgi:hypothetical protein
MNIFEMNYYLFIKIYLRSELINLIIVGNENFFLLKNRVFLHLKRINHFNNFY